MLALLDHNALGAATENPLAGAMDVPVTAQLAGLAVVHHQDVHAREEVEECRLLSLDPVVHRVAHHHFRLLHLREHADLELGVDVAEKEKLRRTKLLGELGLEVGEDAEPRLQRLPALQVVGVLPLPAKALSRRVLDTRPVDAAGCQALQLGDRIVAAYHPDHLHGVQNRPGDAEVDGGATERVGGLAERREDGIERDAADHEKAHLVTSGRGRRCRRA